MLKIIRKFFAFCSEGDRKKFRKAILTGLLEAIGEAFKIPAIMLILLDLTHGPVTTRSIWTAVIIMVVSLIVILVAKDRGTMLQTEGGYNSAAFKRIELAKHLRYLPMGYFNEHSLGEITSVTTNTMDNLSNIATRVIMLTTQGILNTTVMLILVSIFDWRVGLIGFAGEILFLCANALMQRASETVSQEKVDSDTEVVSEVMEYLQGIAEVKSYNLTGIHTKKMNRAFKRNADVNLKMEYRVIPFMTLQNWIMWLTGGAMMFLSVNLYFHGLMSLAYCVGMCICAFMVFGSLDTAGGYSALLHMINVCVDKANAILAIPTMDLEGKDIQPEHLDMETENITFSYEKKKIIDGISLKIPENTTAALIGPSGGGKTTLTNLLSRFWDVDSGEVLLGGHNVKEYNYDSLMKNFSFVFQTVYLFHDTIANNIRFGRPEASMDEVIAAAKMACCHDFIMELPDGYDTVVGEAGSNLSGGERQRISIARAIMKDAPIIILDEATANIDPENEKDLMEAVSALTRDKTIVMIAHRLQTVRNANQIFAVDHGKIVQRGTHEQLITEEGIYKRFIESREKAVSWRL